MLNFHPFKDLYNKFPFHPFRDLYNKFPYHPFRDLFQKLHTHFSDHFNHHNFKNFFSNITKYTLIPILIKIMLDIFGKEIPLIYNIFLRLSLGILSILFSNLLKIIKTEECSNDKNVLKIVQKEIYISYIQYATSYILPTLILLLLDFVGIGELIFIGEETPFIGHLIQLGIWIIGFCMSFYFIDKFNFNKDCSDEISHVNRIIGILSIFFVIGYEVFHAFF